MNPKNQLAFEIATQLLARDPASKMLGIEIVESRYDHCTTSMLVREDMVNGFGVCHGGFIFALGDSAVAFACASQDKASVSASSEIEFVTSAKVNDRLFATADVIHHKGRKCFCNIMIKNQNGELIAITHARQIVLDELTTKGQL